MAGLPRILAAAGVVGLLAGLPAAASATDDAPDTESATAAAAGATRASSGDPSIDSATPSSAVAATPTELAARQYEQAHARYVAGDVVGALAAMQEAYRLSRRPELLFNLGQLNRELARCGPAIEHYQRYLAELPAGPRADDAAHAIETLSPSCPDAPRARPAAVPTAERAPRPPAAPPPAPEEGAGPERRRHGSRSRIVGWSALGTGAAMGAGALALALHARQLAARVESRDVWSEDLDRQGERTAAAAGVVAVVAAGITAGGAVLLWPRAEHRDGQATLSVVAQSGAIGAAYSARF
jgi:tetratricopeptide (TPR) repeat protein